MNRKKYIIGNWKMNNNLSQTKEFFKTAETNLNGKDFSNIVLGVAVPSLNLLSAKKFSSNIKIGSQNIYHEDSGAFTGEISVDMIKDVGVKFSIVGHSERRQLFKETDKEINLKIKNLIASEITPIFCLGETEEQYNIKSTVSVLKEQVELGMIGVSEIDISKVVIAYEPIWAIGTGKTATPKIAQETIFVIRKQLASLYSKEISDNISILYGGSVKPDNIKEIMAQPDIDGVLVGGASIKAESFVALFHNK